MSLAFIILIGFHNLCLMCNFGLGCIVLKLFQCFSTHFTHHLQGKVGGKSV